VTHLENIEAGVVPRSGLVMPRLLAALAELERSAQNEVEPGGEAELDGGCVRSRVEL
jgi:hypothetical protein